MSATPTEPNGAPDDGARDTHDRTIRESWDANAEAWTRVVRDGLVPSRRLGTDAAIIAACDAVLRSPAGARVLDVGCGEGWLARELAGWGAHVLGIDGSAPLVAIAQAEVEPAQRASLEYAVVPYDVLVARDDVAPGPFDLVVANFALLADDIVPLLVAMRRRLAAGGRLVVQTVHPWAAAGDRYMEEWRHEHFDGFGVPFPSPMPWFFRTLEGWIAALRAADLVPIAASEPRHPETTRPLSLVLTLAAAPSR